MNTRTQLLSKKSGPQSYKESCLEGGEFLTTIYLSHISPFHICFSVKKDFLQGKQGPGSCSCKVNKMMTPAQLSSCSSLQHSHKENTLFPLVKSHYRLFQNHDRFPDLVSFPGQMGYKKQHRLWNTSEHHHRCPQSLTLKRQKEKPSVQVSFLPSVAPVPTGHLRQPFQLEVAVEGSDSFAETTGVGIGTTMRLQLRLSPIQQ